MDKKERNSNRYSMLYVLKVLVEHSDAQHPLTQSEIIKYLEDDYDFPMRRAAVSDNLKALSAFEGVFDIKGLDTEMDSLEREDDEKKPEKRGVWIKRSFSDKELQLLVDSVLYSKYISNDDSKKLIEKINALGSKSFRDKRRNVISRLSTVPHTGYTEFIKELGVLQQAIAEELKVTFSYGNYHKNGQTHIFETEQKIVSPYHLAFVNGYYYMIGWDDKNEIIDHYRIDKIKDAKKLNTKAKLRTDTELKGTIVSDYLSSHPFMSTAKPEKILFKIESKNLSQVIDTFGNSYEIKKNETNYKTIEVSCNKEDGFYWAMQNGGTVEILEPQELRDQIRDAVEGMAMRYLQRDGDRYTEAIRKFDINWDLDLSGIIIGPRTAHLKLKNLKCLCLSDNNISDISFIDNYENMNVIKLMNNPIKDLTPLAKRDKICDVWLKNLPVTDLSPLKDMKSLSFVSLELDSNVDYSVLYELKNLKSLSITHNNDVDIEKLKEMLPNVRISSYERRKQNPSMLCYYPEYPLNVVREAFGYGAKITGEIEKVVLLVEGIFEKLTEEERAVANLVFEDNMSDLAIISKLNISHEELIRRWRSIQDKLKNKYYNKVLDEYVVVPEVRQSMEKLNHMLNTKVVEY